VSANPLRGAGTTMFSLLIGLAVVVVLYIALRLARCGTTSRPILERGFGGFARAAPPRRRGKSGLCGLQQSEGRSAPAPDGLLHTT
jgi:hypothetical protein